jgi:competence protein ComEA
MRGIQGREDIMGNFVRGLLKNYKLCAKILAGIALLSLAIVLYLQKSAESATDEDILVVELAEDASEPDAPSDASPGVEETDATATYEAPPPVMIVVDVGGAVNNPAVFILPESSRVYEALEAAGGLLPQADMSEINKAAVLKDGDRIYVPNREEVAAKTPVPRSAGGGAGTGVTNAADSSETPAGGATGGPVNINTADSRELQTLSGVGPSTAQKILDYRETNGRFERIEDIKRVSGIGDKTFEKLKDKLAVN